MKKLFSVFGVMMVMALSCFAVVSGEANTAVTGRYEVTTTGKEEGLTVAVTFKDGIIEDVSIVSSNETPGISDPAIKQIPAAIVANNSVAVDAVSSATLTSDGIINAVKQAIIMAGGKLEDYLTIRTVERHEKTDATLTADVVVVGGGISGLSAALSAADQGASVILLEKMPALGGSAALASGSLITVNSENAPEELDDGLERVLKFWKETMALGPKNDYPDYDRLIDFLSSTGATVDYFIKSGVEFQVIRDGGYAVLSVAKGNGAGLIKSLGEVVKRRGVDIHLSCPATELIIKNGAVVGVKASDDTTNYTINAKNIILATGGFIQNKEMMEKYIPGLPDIRTRGAVAETGDGFAMALSAGAVMYENSWPMFSSTMLAPDYKASLNYTTQPVVNSKGVRFTNEGEICYSAVGVAMTHDNNFPYYAIYDSGKADLIEALEAGIGIGETFKAETIEKLAEAMKVAPDVLSATIKRYNDFCEKGKDEDFGKPVSSSGAIKNGAFYAVKFYPTTIGTLSGFKTDRVGHALNSDGNVIKGLYCVGEMSNRAFYNEHYIGGASLGLYSTMGKRAGESAASE